MKKIVKLIVLTVVPLSLSCLANAQTVEKKTLTIDGARRVIAGAIAYARKNNAPGGVIAVVDEGGNLMALERLDGTFAAGANISIGKARTAVLFKRPTKAFEDIIKNGRTAMIALPDAYFTPLQGGVPITIDGQIVGGVGVSGAASAQQDEELAMAGAGVFSAETKTSEVMPEKSPVLFSDPVQTSAALLKGAFPLDRTQRNHTISTQLPTKQVLTLDGSAKDCRGSGFGNAHIDARHLRIVEPFEHQQITTVIDNGDHDGCTAFPGFALGRSRDPLRSCLRNDLFSRADDPFCAGQAARECGSDY